MPDIETYVVTCGSCQKPFDALGAPWCSCLVTERTLGCPACASCFCKAPATYKLKFWREAPKPMWERKLQEHAAGSIVAAANNPPIDAAKRPLVLLVDDEPVIQTVARAAISGLGYGLVVAQNGEQGLEAARRYKPDLVLSDALMPKLDGRDMCRRLKDDPETASIKVVIMTSLYTGMKHHHDATKLYKIDDYLNKPLDFVQLKNLLQKYLGPPQVDSAEGVDSPPRPPSSS